MKKNVSYYKQIHLLPTAFMLDVIVGKRREDITQTAIAKVGKSEKFWKKWLDPGVNNCMIYLKAKGAKRMVMFLNDFDPAIIAHEATHVTWELDNEVKFNYTLQSHELQAYMIEYIVSEVLKLKKIEHV